MLSIFARILARRGVIERSAFSVLGSEEEETEVVVNLTLLEERRKVFAYSDTMGCLYYPNGFVCLSLFVNSSDDEEQHQ